MALLGCCGLYDAVDFAALSSQKRACDVVGVFACKLCSNGIHVLAGSLSLLNVGSIQDIHRTLPWTATVFRTGGPS